MIQKILLTFFIVSTFFISQNVAHAATQAELEAQIKSLQQILVKLLAERGKTTTQSTGHKSENFIVSNFQAQYFNSKKPTVVVGQETVSEITLNYAWDDIWFKVVSEDFAAKYTGTITALNDGDMLLSVAQGWSETRVTIDGNVIYNGTSDKEQKIFLKKGIHTVLVEYLNNWHTVNFKVQFSPFATSYERADIAGILKKQKLPQNTELLLGSVSESGSKDNTISLKFETLKNPSVLLLSSHSPVTWKLEGRTLSPVKAIFVTSYGPGSRVLGNGNIPIYKLGADEVFLVDSFYPSCSGSGRLYYCESLDEFLTLKTTLEQETGMKLAGASLGYSVSSLKMPETLVTDVVVKEIQRQVNDAVKKQNEAENENIDSVF